MSKGDKKSKRKAIMSPQAKESRSKFLAGIRVLVVDDDETCLLWVENLLLTCNFKATTTLYAREAIEMLRRNKEDFDLVITDVQMPEIDGFQLLEIIGLEMDLPVIMMSIYSHQQYVQKGVQHGAVDYLVKPVRLEEIQNVWQHVLRKRKDLVKEKRAEYQAKLTRGGLNSTLADTAFNAGDDTSYKRPRDQQKSYDDDDSEDDDSGRDNEAPKTKRPRVVWDAVLHKKFLAAVNHLGLEKAVPKKILELMDSDSALTRENIASHLQKYRMFLKKLEAEQNTPEGSGASNSFEAMNYIGCRYPNSSPPDFTPRLGGYLREPLSVSGISSSELIQFGQNLRNSISTQVRLQHNNGLPSFPNGNSLQGMGRGFEQSPSLSGNAMTHLCGYNHGHDTAGFGLSDNFLHPNMLMNGSNTNCSLMVPGSSQVSQTTCSPKTGGLTNGVMPVSSNSGLVDQIGFNDSWKPDVPNLQSPLQISGAFAQNKLPNGNTSPGNQQLLLGLPYMPQPPVTGDSSSVGHNVSFPLTHGWDNNKKTDSHDLNSIFESLNPIEAPSGGNEIMGQNSQVANGDNFFGQFHGTESQTVVQQTGIHEQVTLLQDDFIPNNIESMDDIMNSITTTDNNEPTSMFMDGEFNFDAYGPSPGL